MRIPLHGAPASSCRSSLRLDGPQREPRVRPEGAERRPRQHDRKSSTKHRHLASLPARTVLLCSRRSREERIPMPSLTWLGHASLRLDTDDGSRIYIDPFLSGPTTPETEKVPERADVIAVTHGHGDHAADVVSIQQQTGATVLGMVELMGWFT